MANNSGYVKLKNDVPDTAGEIVKQNFTAGAAHVLTGSSGGASASTTLASFLVAGGAAQTGTAIAMASGRRTFQAVANGSAGAFAATVTIMVSLDNVNFKSLGQIVLSGTATVANSDGFPVDAAWAWVRADVSAFSGTGATCIVYTGV